MRLKMMSRCSTQIKTFFQRNVFPPGSRRVYVVIISLRAATADLPISYDITLLLSYISLPDMSSRLQYKKYIYAEIYTKYTLK